MHGYHDFYSWDIGNCSILFLRMGADWDRSIFNYFRINSYIHKKIRMIAVLAVSGFFGWQLKVFSDEFNFKII